MTTQSKRFRNINLYTIIAVYFLILVGGIVRSMGAGMGCPDWPKCFGNYIPPSSAALLPENYEDFYVEKRIEKNNRLASLLDVFGFDELSEKILSDPNASNKTYFDTKKAWVEYINRLLGVLIGLFIILNMIFAFSSRDGWVRILGVVSFVLVVFQGWIGSLVVSTNLLPGFISFHMGLALLLVCFLLYQRFRAFKLTSGQELKGRVVILVTLILFGLQIIFGTQVREQIDQIHFQGIDKSDWVSQLSLLFYVHRSYSILLVGLIGYISYLNKELILRNPLFPLLLFTVVVEILLGVIMVYFSFPAFAQPAHLFVGSISFGVIFYLFLQSNYKPVFT
ncbi:MAG: COX15/CtaA family protein [Cyclobacteriaceae bacterium]